MFTVRLHRLPAPDFRMSNCRNGACAEFIVTFLAGKFKLLTHRLGLAADADAELLLRAGVDLDDDAEVLARLLEPQVGDLPQVQLHPTAAVLTELHLFMVNKLSTVFFESPTNSVSTIAKVVHQVIG